MRCYALNAASLPVPPSYTPLLPISPSFSPAISQILQFEADGVRSGLCRGHRIVLIPENISDQLDFIIVLMPHMQGLKAEWSSSSDGRKDAVVCYLRWSWSLLCWTLCCVPGVDLEHNKLVLKHSRALHLFPVSPPTDYLMGFSTLASGLSSLVWVYSP